MILVFLIFLFGMFIFSYPIIKIIEVILKKFTRINTNLIWVQLLIDVPSIYIGYEIFYYVLLLYIKYLGIEY
jgi:hypothetical protein